uniref:RanBP2-type domain-containing protein n=1 Tax=Angiostrongylus cantonensis TaxID=6313 RepID=A0A0K0CYM4_ANGCA
LFDLNAYYYERMVGSVVHDGTAAQQCAFMSLVHPIPMHLKDEDFSLVKDSIVDTSLITRFISNVSDAEQMFYPSALEIFSIYVAGTKKCFQFTLPSLPNQLLSAICANLELHVADAKPASTWLSALGFYKKEIYSAKDQYGHLCSVLSVLISHQRAGAIVQFIKHCESPESRHMIATWIWEEIDKASKKLHETIAPLFARFSAPLSPAGRKSLAHVHDVFVAGMQIIRHLVASGDREQDETKEYMTSLEAQLFAVENLFSYSTVIHQLIYSKILPVAEDREIRLAMEKSLKERRSKIPGRQLNVDKLVTRMRKRSPSEPLWHAEGPQWYPPALLNLLGPILLLNIPTLWKGQLLAFYLLDYANCTIACTAGSGLAENIADLVTRQMNGILSMKKDEVQNVYKMWCADCGNVTILDSVPFGKFHWQCYLARNRRYDEMSELPIPLNADHDEGVLEYLQLLPAIKMLRKSDICSSMKSVNQPAWPANIKQAIEKFENERCLHSSYESELPVLNHGKTPVPLKISKINANGWIGASGADQHFNKSFPSRISEPSDASPSRKSTELNSSEDDLLFSRLVLCFQQFLNISINTLNNITDILRTPRALACAAAQAESQRKWIDTTPEGELRTAAPRSILKSGKWDRGASPSRTRLHFDLPSSNSSVNISENFENITQPNFDESFEYYGKDERMDMTTEEFVPRVSPDHYHSEGTNDVLQKSLEIQDEDEEEGGGHGRGTVEIEEMGVTTEQFVPLVSSDLKHHNQSLMATDKEFQTTNSVLQGTNGVLQKSFEVQDEDEDEGGDYGRNTVQVEQQNEDDFGNIAANPSEIYFEEQEEEEIPQQGDGVTLGENYGRQRDHGSSALEENDLRTSIEIQEESYERFLCLVMEAFGRIDCCQLDLSRKAALSAKVEFGANSKSEDRLEGPMISQLEKQVEFDVEDGKHVQEISEDTTVESSARSNSVAENVSVATESATTCLIPNFTLEISHVKLVDYSFSNSTFETNSASRTLKKASDPLCSVSVTLDVPLTMLNRMDSPTATTDTGNGVGVCASLQSEEAHSSNTSTARKQVSLKKTGRLSGTPTRHSLRLRERVVEPVGKETEDGDVPNSIPRRSPARKRRNAEVTQSTILELPTPNPMVVVDEESDADTTGTHRVLRRRTPTRAGEERLPTPASKTSRTTRKTSGHGKEAHLDLQPKAGDESSRRTPTRSMSKSKMNNSPSTSRRSSSCTSNAVKELQDTSAIPALGGLDARSFFNMVTERKMAEIESSRRRTLSDSGILDLQTNSGQVKVLDVIPEVEEESRSRRSRSRMKENDDIGASTNNKEKTPRPRRATSASVLEETPPRITRTHSGKKYLFSMVAVAHLRLFRYSSST